MKRLLIATVLLAPVAALAAAPTIPAGQYVATTQIQDIQNDTSGICAQILTVGSVQAGVADIPGLGQTFQTVTPTPSSSGGYTLGVQICNFPALPATLNTTGKTPSSGTTTCSLNGTTYTLTTASGQGTIVNVAKTASDAFYLNATSTVQVGGSTLCTLKTSSLFVYSGRRHP